MSEKKKDSPARDGAGRFVKAGGAAAPAVALSEEERRALRVKELEAAKAIIIAGAGEIRRSQNSTDSNHTS